MDPEQSQERQDGHHRISAHIQEINGAHRVTELHVVLNDPGSPKPVTDNMLRSLDLRALAKWSRDVAKPELHGDLVETTRQIVKTKPRKKRITVEEVAELWLVAYEAEARNPQGRVLQVLHEQGVDITERTVARRLRRARELDLIPTDWR